MMRVAYVSSTEVVFHLPVPVPNPCGETVLAQSIGPVAGVMEEEEEDVEEADDDNRDMYMDTECLVVEHKTLKHVMTVTMAVKAGKASKNHKLHVRPSREDRTRSDAARRVSLVRRRWHQIGAW